MSAAIQWIIIGFCVLLSLMILMRDLCPTLWRQLCLRMALAIQADNVPHWLFRLLGSRILHVQAVEAGCSGCSRCHCALRQSPSNTIDGPESAASKGHPVVTLAIKR